MHPRLYSSLIYFECCGRLSSFSAAARELCVTTGAVSQQIRKLEQQLGLVLFERASGGIALTDPGRELLAVTSESIMTIQSTIARLQSNSDAAVVRIRSTPSFAFKWLIPRLKAFSQTFPAIKVETFAEAALLNLQQADFDLAIDYRQDGAIDGYEVELLLKEQLLPVVSPDYPQGLGGIDTEWSSMTLLHDALPWAGAARDAEWRYWLDRSGLDTVVSDRGHYFNRSDMAIAAAEAGLGVAMARSSLVQQELAQGRLWAPFEAQPSGCSHYLLLPHKAGSKPAARKLQQWLLGVDSEAQISRD
ncbi:LysR substrate-binding domain-containing protein [Motiliproteus sp.]|uniref:LysR substrate-binding domain-containing protein n=1 Tax=Motiliproteus sp. TaxID=1898955 RepID=UPI003BAC8DEA